MEGESELQKVKMELETWMAKVEKADDLKSRLIVEKLEQDETKEKAKKDMLAWVKKQEDFQKESTLSMRVVQGDILNFGKRKQDLVEKLRRCQAELLDEKTESTKLKQKFKICAQIPEIEVRFTAMDKEDNDDNSESVRGVFVISQTPSVLLQGGQALVTFEEETVASQILRTRRCSVSCEDLTLDVKPRTVNLDPVVKFEIHLDVFRKELKVCNIPSTFDEERMKAQLELSLSRPSRGGGELVRVEYDKKSTKGHITFLHSGVAELLVLGGWHKVVLDTEVNVQLEPVYNQKLCKFQTFCGFPKRTVLVDDIKDIMGEEDLQDQLEIYFQKPSNSGGEIESIQYVSAGNSLWAFFFDDKVETDNSL